MGENNLIQTVVTATGLPSESLERELLNLLNQNGKSPETLCLDDLREVLADYLQTVFLELADTSE
ncbi:MAG: hypothetical protein AAGB31_09800 [Bdellovibrio sp.]